MSSFCSVIDVVKNRLTHRLVLFKTVMIQAGNAIDCTIGVVFGLSTLSAAAIGQICSDASGVVFGGTVERLAKAAGLPSANLTAAQTKLPIVARTAWAGSLIGIVLGCTIGLVNLFFIDTSRSSTMKLQALNEGQDFEFTVEVSNTVRSDATALTVEGPDVDGVLASMTTALAKQGCSIIEISAKRVPAKGTAGSRNAIKDTFYVVDSATGEPFEDDQLEMVARSLLESTRTPLRSLELARAAVVHNRIDSPLDTSFSEKFKTLEHRMEVVRKHTAPGKEVTPPGLTRRITVVKHLPKEERDGN
jgi:Transmembrane protein 65